AVALDEGGDALDVDGGVAAGQHVDGVGRQELVRARPQLAGPPTGDGAVLEFGQPHEVDRGDGRQHPPGAGGGGADEPHEPWEHQVELHGDEQEVQVVLGVAAKQVTAQDPPRV